MTYHICNGNYTIAICSFCATLFLNLLPFKCFSSHKMSHFVGKVKNCFSISVLSELIDFPPLLLATLHITFSDFHRYFQR